MSTAHVIEPTNAYTVLWMELIRWRQHDFDSKALPVDASKVDLRIWPGQIIRLIEQKGSSKDIDAAFAKAKKIQDYETRHDGLLPNGGRICEATFYVGEYLLSSRIPQDQQQGAQLLKTAKCPKEFIEYVGVQADLSRLPSVPG
jgi:hypothetical protein